MNSATLRFVVTLCLLGTTLFAQENWPRFRGPNGVGVSTTSGFPVKWTPEDYAWTIDLPGKGHSSPVIWGDSLFITAAAEKGNATERQLVCLDATTGDQRWARSISLDPSHLHRKNSWASGTPATDGQMVYVAFADERRHQLLAVDFSGNKVWQKDLGSFTSQHGPGGSPIIYRDLVILTNDQQGPSRVVAFNKKTGDVAWETPRVARKTSYATPMILESGNTPPQLICLSGAMGLTSLNPTNGRMNWQTGALPLRTVASPVVANGLIFASCGSGGRGEVLIGVDPATGLNAEKRVRIERKTNLPYVPTPVEHKGRLFLWTDAGIVVCIDPATGDEIWKNRVGGNFSGSPVCIDGRLYCISEAGDVVVVEAGPTFKLLGKTSLGEQSYATPAVANGRLYLRTFNRLMCLKARS